MNGWLGWLVEWMNECMVGNENEKSKKKNYLTFNLWRSGWSDDNEEDEQHEGGGGHYEGDNDNSGGWW